MHRCRRIKLLFSFHSNVGSNSRKHSHLGLFEIPSTSGRTPRRCLDCFGGSGTTALTCQFVAVPSVTIEVNPFLGDLIAAKLTTYSIERLQQDFLTVFRTASSYEPKPDLLLIGAPATMVEPGLGGRWVFNRDVAIAILRLRLAIEALTHPKSSSFAPGRAGVTPCRIK